MGGSHGYASLLQDSRVSPFGIFSSTLDYGLCFAFELQRDVFKRNGTAVDAAIAGLFCSGVVHPNSMGLGGGFIMNIYIKSERKVYNLMGRETAPKRASALMFVNSSVSAAKGKLDGVYIGVP